MLSSQAYARTIGQARKTPLLPCRAHLPLGRLPSAGKRTLPAYLLHGAQLSSLINAELLTL